MRVITALAAPILLALVMYAVPAFPTPRSTPDLTASSGMETTGEVRASIGAPDVDSRVLSLPGQKRQAGKHSGAPMSGVSGAVIGVATYCAPNPPYCTRWGGDALLGAMPGFTYGDAPHNARVCRSDGAPCVTVTVVSFCACGDRPGGPTVIDLSPAAFRAINGGSLAAGVIDVIVTIGGVALPATDTAP
jgi:hypothetical protein